MYHFDLPISFFGYRKIAMVGSRTIFGASTPASDYDYVVLARSLSRATRNLRNRGFIRTSLSEGSTYKFKKDTFVTFRNGDNVNIILTSSDKFYSAFKQANDIAVKLRIVNKAKRIELFQYMLYEK